MNLPNKLTLARCVMTPIFLALMVIDFPHHYAAALLVFILASLTDWLDGKIARKNNLVTNLGKFLDPLADKLLTIAAMTMFCQWGSFPAWALMIVLTREFAVSGLRMVAGPKGKVIAAGKSGKFKTASSMVGLCVLMAFPTNVILAWVVVALIVITTVYSGIEYFVQNWKCLWD